MRRLTSRQEPRIITRPETLRIGDYIEITWPVTKTTDRERIYRGVIGNREQSGRYTFYNTNMGEQLLTVGPDLKQPKIVLLAPAPELDTALTLDLGD